MVDGRDLMCNNDVEVLMEDRDVAEVVKYTKALLAIQVQLLSTDENREKPEVLLAHAGLTAREISELLGKSLAAVTKSIQRAGKKGK